MQAIPRKIVFVKLSIIFVAVLVAAFGLTRYTAKYHTVSAASDGPSPSFTNAPGETNCTVCHGDFTVNSGTGSVALTGVPANYLPNQTIPMTVTVSQSDGVLYGFQMTAVDSRGRRVGTYTLPPQTPAQLQLVNGLVDGNNRQYLEHTSQGITPTQFGSKTWTFNWTAPAQRVGKISFYVAGNAANSDGSPAGDYIYTGSRATFSGTAAANFDGDQKSDFSVFRPSNGVWYGLNSTNGSLYAAGFGLADDIIAPGDYDGDGKTDFAVYRPSNFTWYIQRSTAGFYSYQSGVSTVIPVAGDYDGDGKTDIAHYHPTAARWTIVNSSTGQTTISSAGGSGYTPVPGDYDGDGKTDIAVFHRVPNGNWFIQRSTTGIGYLTSFGLPTDKPVPADYDGDGKTDIAVFRPSNGTWYILGSTDGFFALNFGINTDKPVPGDYDGDGKADIAVYRDGDWYGVFSSTTSFFGLNFGLSSDRPVPAAYLAP